MSRPDSPHKTSLSRRNLIVSAAAAAAAPGAVPIANVAASADADTSPPGSLEFIRDMQFEPVAACIGDQARANFQRRLDDVCIAIRIGFDILGGSKASLQEGSKALSCGSMDRILWCIGDAREFAESLLDLTGAAELRLLSAALDTSEFYQAAAAGMPEA
jgi:hypothetical protein